MSALFDATDVQITLNCTAAKLFLAREDEATYERLSDAELVPVGRHEGAQLVRLAVKQAAADLGIPVPRVRYYLKTGTSDGVRVLGGGVDPGDFGTVIGRAYRAEGPSGEIWIAMRTDAEARKMVLTAVHETAHVRGMDELEAQQYEDAWDTYLDDSE